jgi:hypothetical protein
MKFLSLLFLFVAPSSFAYEGFRCAPSLRETRFQVLVKDQNVEIRVANPLGYKFMPQFSSPLSVFNLSFAKMQGEDLSGLGESFAFSWPREKCDLETDDLMITCQGEAQEMVNGIKSYGISTTEITEKYQREKFEKRRFRLSVEKENLYFVNLEFFKQNCEKF